MAKYRVGDVIQEKGGDGYGIIIKVTSDEYTVKNEDGEVRKLSILKIDNMDELVLLKRGPKLTNWVLIGSIAAAALAALMIFRKK